MTNNIKNHISDKASSVIFDPTNTEWNEDVTDVQTALGQIGYWCNKDKGNAATETTKGIASISTVAQVTAGTDNSTFVTPLKVKNLIPDTMASESVYGWTRYANRSEAIDKTLNTKGASIKTVADVFSQRISRETVSGSIKLATQPAAVSGVDDTTAMTPLRVKQAMAALSSKGNPASGTMQGYVTIATIADTLAGSLNEAYAVSPYSFRRAIDDLFEYVIAEFSGTEAELPSGWALCDGKEANGKTTPNLINMFVMGGDFDQIGNKGGSTTHNIAEGLTVSETTLTYDQMPKHSHDRGVMSISGMITSPWPSEPSRIFRDIQSFGFGSQNAYPASGIVMGFSAARTWTGETSQKGSNRPHIHTITGSTQTYIPAYYTLAYIMYVGTT